MTEHTQEALERMRVVVKYLRGEAPLGDRWFGEDPPPGRVGRYWWRAELQEAFDELTALLSPLQEEREPRPLEDWHEDFGPALWWTFPVEETPYVGSPGDSDWPGYHSHWTPLPVPALHPQEVPDAG